MKLVRFENLSSNQHILKNELLEKLFKKFDGLVYELKSRLIGKKLIVAFRDKRANKYWARVQKSRVEIYLKER